MSALSSIIGRSPGIQDVIALIKTAASTRSSVLIQGETGTGKELVARALHEGGPRRQAPFVVVNCSTLPETLLESELFGHERGAFTGAFRTRRGRFQLADKGTLFIDEIGGVPLGTQVKLLRVLQEGEFQPVGSEENVKVDVRLIAATNKDLRAEVKKRRFREDLFYRVHVIPIFIPPLRARRGDIPVLAEHFLKKYSAGSGQPTFRFDVAAMEALTRHNWPGNVRELENVVERITVLTQNTSIKLDDLPPMFSGATEAAGAAAGNPSSDLQQVLGDMVRSAPDLKAAKMTLKELTREVERESIRRALLQCNWKQRRAARSIGMDESTLRYLMKRYGIVRPDTRPTPSRNDQ